MKVIEYFFWGRSAKALWLILVCINVGKLAAQESVIQLSHDSEQYSIGKALIYYEDKTGALSDAVILSGRYDSLFIPSEKDVLNFGVTQSVIWVKFKLQNQIHQTIPQWILTEKNALVDKVILYSKTELNQWKREETGDAFKFNQRFIHDHEFGFYINLPDSAEKTYYMRFETQGSMQMPLVISSPTRYQKSVQLSQLMYGLFTGALIIMFFYNLVVFFSLKDYSYLAYSFFILCNLALMNSYSGHTFQYLFPDNPDFANLFIPIMMAIMPGSVALFSLSFLKPANITPSLRIVLYATTGLSILLTVATFFLSLRLSTSLSGMLIIIGLIAAIAAGISGWLKGDKAARYYVIAWVLLIISGLITSFRNFGFLENNFFTIHGSRFATILEVALLSLALADRYNRFRKEKDEAQRELIEVQRRTNIELEQKVRDRTQQLNETLGKVEIERAKSDELLLNVLPKEIMVELKETGKIVPRHYALATILFTDIKNFTKFAEKLPPEEVIKSLNECFLVFDDICRKYRLEKIKTLGDGYMAVGGLPVENKTNPSDAVMAGLEMQQWIAGRNINHNMDKETAWEIRIGINTGPVVAGIIGKHKFVYDIWGDAVNMASRMESSGQVGYVNISDNTFQHIKEHFKCEYHGRVAAKNKGDVDLYHVLAPLPGYVHS